jgi:hypothetical protein
MVNDRFGIIGIGYFPALSLVFVALKLSGHIDWPWLWVLSPVWGSWLVAGLIFTMLYLIGKAIGIPLRKKSE